jgi:hypothetical protein
LKFELPRFFSGFKLTQRNALLVCLSIGFFVRLVPELLSFQLPIGTDTIYYALVMKNGVVWANWSSFFTSSWLLYAFIVPLYSLLQVDPFSLLKIVAPLLFGLNVAGVYWFSRKMLGWSMKIGILVGIFFALQLASLRISWDLLRNTLGLGILLFAFSYVKDVNSKRGFVLFASLSLLSVFAHEYAAVILLFSIIGLVVWRLVKRQMNAESKRLLLGILPAMFVFVIGIVLRSYQVQNAPTTNIIGAGDTFDAKVGGLFFLVNYLNVNNSVDAYANYWALALNVALLFVVLFLSYLFFVVRGFFRNDVLDFWTALLLVGAFGCLVIPFFALDLWHRWMFMLAYPFTFYAVNGLRKVSSKFREGKTRFSLNMLSKKAMSMVLITFVLGCIYLATPILMTHTGASLPSKTLTSKYFSVGPSLPYEDVDGVKQAMSWLDGQMTTVSSVILQYSFLFWGQLYLDKSHTIVYFDINADAAVNNALNHSFSTIFFIWWNQPIGWYEISVPNGFVSVQDFGRISVYEYEIGNVSGS